MQPLVDTLIANGYLVVFLWVFAAQAGMPIPAVPILLAAGALAGTGHLHLATTAILSLLACLLGDALWFQLGRSRGRRVLVLLCRMSLEPEVCVRNTRSMFARNQALTLILAKFVPGLSTMAPPLAGMSGVSWQRFLWFDGLGSALWTLAFLLPGYALSDRLEVLAENAAVTGAWLLGVLGVLVFAFVVWRVVRRWMFLRSLRIARIDPVELQQRLAAAEPPFLVDLRHAHDFATDPRVIPGAIHFATEDVDLHHGTIPRDRDVVLYCT